MASDQLFFYLFQSNPDLILRWLQDLPADAGGYSFSAPVLKEADVPRTTSSLRQEASTDPQLRGCCR